MPRVSVVLPVYNAHLYLSQALDSVLQQDLTDFELIVIDDGSSDQSSDIINTYETKDQRIRAFRQATSGLPLALTRGIQLATGAYIARMDADDICRPDRLRKQVGFLETHTDYGVCGSWVEIMGIRTGELWRYPVDDEAIRSQLVFNAPFAHPAVMIRRRVMEEIGGYSVAWTAAEDYELWTRLADHTRFANLPEVLLQHRLHDHQKGALETLDGRLGSAVGRIHEAYLDRLGIKYGRQEFEMHEAISNSLVSLDRDYVGRAGLWLERLGEANAARLVFPKDAFLN